MTSSIPFRAVTREIVDAIHTRTTVLTSVIYTVIDVCKFNKTLFISLQNLTTSKSEKRNILNGYNAKRMVTIKNACCFPSFPIEY